MAKTTLLQKLVYGVTGVVNCLFGIVYLGTAGIKGWNGTGGSDTMLFQLVAYVSIVMIIVGLLAFFLLIKNQKRLSLILGILLIVTAIPQVLFTLFISGLLDLVLGVAVLFVRRETKVSPPS